MRKTISAGLLVSMGLLGSALWLAAASPHPEPSGSKGTPFEAQEDSGGQKKVIRKAVFGSVPDGYSRVGDTDLYLNQTSNSLDFYGLHAGSYYGSTFNNEGYKLAMSVNGTSASVDCANGTTISGVTCKPIVEKQGIFARVIYRVTNTTDADATVSLGTKADVMIGNNDAAPISRRIDTLGNTYGLSMRDGGGAQLCLLFGSGLVGVTPVSDFWFGHYSLNGNVNQMIGNYSSGSNWMQENGSYDSGMGWCWKDRVIPAGQTIDFSYLLGVGDITLEPSSSFAVTPDDPEGWNDLTLPHQLILEGTYESPAGQRGRIEYAVEESEEWLAMTEELNSGENFTATLTVMFDPAQPEHKIRFRTVDGVGNLSTLPPIVYKDVAHCEFSGIEGKDYYYKFGDPVELQGVACEELGEDEFVLVGYANNVNAGTASVNVEGVFPNTIGRKRLEYEIQPIDIKNLNWYSTYDNLYFTVVDYEKPEYLAHTDFVECRLPDGTVLERGVDYDMYEYSNVYVGTAYGKATGKGNYTGEQLFGATIRKSWPYEEIAHLWSHYELPPEDVTYDGEEHPLVLKEACGLEPLIWYRKDNAANSSGTPVYGGVPKEPGTYEVSITMKDQDNFWMVYPHSTEIRHYTFTIYEQDPSDYDRLLAGLDIMREFGEWETPWPVGPFAKNSRIEIKEGFTRGLDLSGFGITYDLDAYADAVYMNPLVYIFQCSKLETLDLSGNHFSGDLTALAQTIMKAVIGSSSGADLSSIRHIDLTGNDFSGNLGVFASMFPNLETLKVSGNKISDIYPALSDKITTLEIGAQRTDRKVTLNSSAPDVASLLVQMPSVMLYDPVTGAMRDTFDILMTEASAEEYRHGDPDIWAVQLHYDPAGGFAMPYVSPNNVYTGQKGDEVTGILLNPDGTLEGSSIRVELNFDDGDANFVGGLTIADLQATILFIFDDYKQAPFNLTAADTYVDRRINVQDVVRTVTMLLEAPSETMLTNAARRTHALGDDTGCHLWIEEGKVWLESVTPVAALAVRHTDGVQWQLSEYGLQAETRAGALVAYSFTGGEIPAGRHLIGLASPDASLIHAEGATPAGADIAIRRGAPSLTGVDATGADDAEADTYDLQGRKVDAGYKGPKVKAGKKSVEKLIK